MEFLFNHYDEIIEIVGAVITLASLITAMTPTPKDDEYLKKALDFLSILKPFTARGTIKMPFTRTKE